MAALDGRLQYSAASANIPLLGNIGLGRLRGGEFTEFAIPVENAGTSDVAVAEDGTSGCSDVPDAIVDVIPRPQNRDLWSEAGCDRIEVVIL
jgi:hypothetical protein